MSGALVEDFLPLAMLAVLALFLFTGFPVAFVLGGVGLAFGVIGWRFDLFALQEFFAIAPRIWAAAAENPALTAAPMLILMGVTLERSGAARRLLDCLEILLRRAPGGLALSVTSMGAIMAATSGALAASVLMTSLLALPAMIQSRYSPSLAAGAIRRSGALGLLLPPSIMLILMADALAISATLLFLAAIVPVLLLTLLHCFYIGGSATLRPSSAPAACDRRAPSNSIDLWIMAMRGLAPPVLLATCVLGSILAGLATPSEAAGVGALGAFLLAHCSGALDDETLRDVIRRTALANAMIFGVLVGATAFAYVFRSLGGDRLVGDLILDSGLGPWGVVLAIVGVVFLLGFFFDWLQVTLIALPVFAPIVADLEGLGDHVGDPALIAPWFAIVVAVILQTSLLAPPFGSARVFFEGAASESIGRIERWKGVAPFVLAQILGLALVLIFPAIALWLPTAVLR